MQERLWVYLRRAGASSMREPLWIAWKMAKWLRCGTPQTCTFSCDKLQGTEVRHRNHDLHISSPAISGRLIGDVDGRRSGHLDCGWTQHNDRRFSLSYSDGYNKTVTRRPFHRVAVTAHAQLTGRRRRRWSGAAHRGP